MYSLRDYRNSSLTVSHESKRQQQQQQQQQKHLVPRISCSLMQTSLCRLFIPSFACFLTFSAGTGPPTNGHALLPRLPGHVRQNDVEVGRCWIYDLTACVAHWNLYSSPLCCYEPLSCHLLTTVSLSVCTGSHTGHIYGLLIQNNSKSVRGLWYEDDDWVGLDIELVIWCCFYSLQHGGNHKPNTQSPLK